MEGAVMKKTVAFILLLGCFHSSVLGQKIAVREYRDVIIHEQPVTFNPNMLAYSQGLPNNFLPFSADTAVQILFNPARAGFMDQKFVYANYLSQSPVKALQSSYGLSSSSYTGNTFSGAVLFGTTDSKWLLQVSNWVNRYTSEATSNILEQSSQSDYYTYPDLRSSMGSSTYSNVACNSLTAVKLSFIRGNGEGAYALGAFGILYTGDYSTRSNGKTEYASYIQYPPYLRMEKYISDYQGESKNTNSTYAAGLEFSLAGSSWDFIAGLTIQKNKIEKSSSNYSNYSYQYFYDYGLTIDSSHQRIYENEAEKLYTDEPFMYGANCYYQHTADWITETDHYFLSSRFYYSDGKIFLHQNGIRSDWYQNNTSLASGDTMIVANGSNEGSRNWGLTVSTGYVVSRTLTDIQFLVGVQPMVAYDEFKEAHDMSRDYYFMSSSSSSYYYPSVRYVTIYAHQVWTAAIQIPIYIDFKPANWCSFYGGLNYQYAYSRDKSNASQPAKTYGTVYETKKVEQSQTQTNSSLYSSSNVYAGMELRHTSGFRMQAAFNNTLSSFSSWNISLGYVF